MVKIELASGNIAIVHSPEPDLANKIKVVDVVAAETPFFFKTPWEGAHPQSNDCLALPGCFTHEDGNCICNTEVSMDQVYVASYEISSIEELVASLHIGAFDPASFDAGTSSNLGDCGIDGLTIFSHIGGDCSSFSMDTIFAFQHKTKQYYLKNIRSIVSIPDSAFAFRNPVHFNSLSDSEARDAYYETVGATN